MKRVQRKRTKGWRMPEGVVYVGRPSKFGNPYRVSEYGDRAISLYEVWLREKLKVNPRFLDELKGKDLACWCKIDKPCHVDVIIKFIEGRI